MFQHSEAFWSGQVAKSKLELIYLQNSSVCACACMWPVKSLNEYFWIYVLLYVD